MTAVLIVDCALHAASIPATYVAPGPLQNIGVSATSGSSTGTLASGAPQPLYAGDTYTIVPGNIIPLGAQGEDGLAGYIPAASDAGDLIIFPLGFFPTHAEFFNATAGVKYEWFYGDTAGYMSVYTFTGPTIAHTASLATVTADSDGGVGNAVIFAIASTVAAGADLLCFRFES